MNRWLWIGMLAGLLAVNTGCLRHNTRGGCSNGMCHAGSGHCGGHCQQCGPQGGKFLGKVGARMRGCGPSCGSCGPSCGSCGPSCGNSCGPAGCHPGPLGWQQGGHGYSSHLNAGPLGHRAPQALENRPFTPGPPSAQVAYPYYTHRGPRDFLLDNPPSIGP